MSDEKEQKQIENEDFTVENGLTVFSRAFHLKRGDCCGSGCRECPYDGVKNSRRVRALRIVSMVPSWTETLVSAGANVVGVTRFCIHPKSDTENLPKVGGTKDISWEKIEELKPDLLILDREENPKSMSERAGVRFWASHVQSTFDVPRDLEALAKVLGGPVAERLESYAQRWRACLAKPPLKLRTWEDLAGVDEWIQLPTCLPEHSRLAYVIWKNPWMLAGRGTFIASMLEAIGAPPMTAPTTGSVSEKYPTIELSELPYNTTFLFSSEPYPFAKKRDEILELKRPSALVDGEVFSWFGIRSLEFLESLQNK